jgi:putative Mg2+ transporter-C (MgtC) family protein
MVLGGFLGLEREMYHKPAGLRTHMLIALGTVIFVVTSIMWGGDDPGKLLSGLITGVGFLGAGAILKSGDHIAGMTTASSVWVSAAIAMAVGFGYYSLAIAGACLAVVVLYIFERLEMRFENEGVKKIVQDEKISIQKRTKESIKMK